MDLSDIKKMILRIDLDDECSYEHLFCIFKQFEKVFNITLPIKAGSSLFRSRQNLGYSNFAKFEELSYPPVKSVIDYSRANKPLQNVFYASDKFETSLAELMPYWSKDLAVGEVFGLTTSVWELVEDIQIILIPDFKNQRMLELFNKLIKSFDQNELEFIDFINTNFNKQGFYDKNVYKMTSAFCNAVKYDHNFKNYNDEGILYTSVQDRDGWNVALSHRIIDSDKLVMKRVWKNFIRKKISGNDKLAYDTFIEPIEPVELDYKNKLIMWKP